MVAIISRLGFLRSAAAIFGCLLFVAGCGAQPTASTPPLSPQPTAEPPPVEDAVTIVVLGDSLSAGFGLPEADAFPALVELGLRERGHTVTVVNAGVSGDTSAGGLARLDWILAQQPEILVVELGGNDALRGQPIENTDRNLREIVRAGLGAGAQVLLLGMDVPSNYGPDYTSKFTAMYETIAADEGVSFLPAFIREVGLDPSLMQADGLHPTAEGHRLLAESLIPSLEGMIASESIDSE